ncbi:hypothetical protein [Cryobacterium arcticum]|uniref:Uncharacterized protein n=1 Tax=Cryobacterium arcticum TaxID=670052 RepID=A0A318A146_9MICO|nr:hypothetical protein [Cryobacterium arcticum]PXA72002.1 hypothetical protein CTB96_03570 [Cryobacterium arcticum]
MSTTLTARPQRAARRTPIYIHIAAWAIPALVLGEFAMLAIVPVATLVIGTLADSRVKPLRWWAGLVAVAYATPLVIWLLRADGAQSLSKDMNPVLGALIVAVAAAFLIKIYTRRKR